jgi:radical SAM protein (TIGR01212 family)
MTNQSPYYQYKDYMTKHHGTPLYKIPIDMDFSCPHRNDDGSGGCSFCSTHGNKAKQNFQLIDIDKQITKAMRFAKDRYNAKKYMAYFQAYTANFDEKHTKQYQEIINKYNFDAVSFGTRPDCIDDKAINFLVKTNKQIETWIDLGVQTSHNKTLKRINRGHDFNTSKTAINKLHDNGIKIAVHVILGLPKETLQDHITTAKELAKLPIDGIKIHDLHIIKNTQLEKEYRKKPFHLLKEYEYGEHLIEFLRYIPSFIPIMRIHTDSFEDELIAPIWNMNKSVFKDYIIYQMQCREIIQGDHSPAPILKASCRASETEGSSTNYELRTTDDQSITFWNEKYKEHYHSPAGARLEAIQKYIIPSKLAERLKTKPQNILDICFGLGYNSLCAINTAIECKQDISITALEMDKRIVGLASKHISTQANDLFNWKECLTSLYNTSTFSLSTGGEGEPLAVGEAIWGDARYTITNLKDKYDIIFLDAFSTSRNSELWTLDFIEQIKKVISSNGIIITYCAALPVRSALIKAGFYVGETPAIGRKRGGTIASLYPENITTPLPQSDLDLIKTTRGIPFRDPHHVLNNKEILRNREKEIKQAK